MKFTLLTFSILLIVKFQFTLLNDDEKNITIQKRKEIQKNLCKNGVEIKGKCICNKNYIGNNCQQKIHCLHWDKENKLCLSCEENFYGKNCEHLNCTNGEEDMKNQKCVCKKPYTGEFCDKLTTKDIYYFYNSRVAKFGPLGALILIPMIIIYYGCEHFAKKRQIKRIEQTWYDQINVSFNSHRIKSLLEEKE